MYPGAFDGRRHWKKCGGLQRSGCDPDMNTVDEVEFKCYIFW